MFNRSINIDILAAWIFWLGGACLSLGDMLDVTREGSGFVGVTAVAFGHLIAVKQAHRQMEERERAAFELGREAGPVRNIR